MLLSYRISKVYHIISLLVRNGQVEKLWLRRQLTEEDKDELLHDPLTCYPAPFPRDNLMLTDAGMRLEWAQGLVDLCELPGVGQALVAVHVLW